MLEGIPEPVRLYFFISPAADCPTAPACAAWADRVEDMLNEFEAHSDDRLDVSVIDPAPFSEDEDRAAAFGLQAVRLQISDDPLYFGVAGSNAVGDEEFIAFMDPQREQFLEYDLAKLVYSLSRVDEPVVGLVSSLPLTGGFDPMQTSVTEPWIVTSQISDLFDLMDLDVIEDEIEDEVDVLLLVHPKGATPRQLYAFEQYLSARPGAGFHRSPGRGGSANPPGGRWPACPPTARPTWNSCSAIGAWKCPRKPWSGTAATPFGSARSTVRWPATPPISGWTWRRRTRRGGDRRAGRAEPGFRRLPQG